VDVRHWFCGMARELRLSAFVITHDVDEAVSMASRVYVLGGVQQGEPSRIVGEVAVDRVTDAGEQFELTPEFLAAKREVMRLLA